MGDDPATSRRGYLRAAGAGLAGGLSGLVGTGAASESESDEEAKLGGKARDSAAATSHYAQVPLGTSARYSQMNNWSQPYHEQQTGQYEFSRWERRSEVADAPQSVMEAVYGETEAPRKVLETFAQSYGGAGYVVTDAWAGLEFYTTGSAAQAVSITALGEYDEGTNWLNLRETDGNGYVANVLDLAVMDLSSGAELARGAMWRHEGYPGTVASSGQHDSRVWANANVNVTLEPNSYYAIYYLGRSIAYSASPITGAWHPPEAGAVQRVGIGHIFFVF